MLRTCWLFNEPGGPVPRVEPCFYDSGVEQGQCLLVEQNWMRVNEAFRRNRTTKPCKIFVAGMGTGWSQRSKAAESLPL